MLSQDIDSLSNFKRDTHRFVKRMKKSGSPVILTINGKAELVVQDADSYQRLMRYADEIESLERLRKSLAEADAGLAVPAREAIKRLGKKR
jgi:PHD/YefM family antitoxin component YafN of YafNO toxin-antitoxin module